MNGMANIVHHYIGSTTINPELRRGFALPTMDRKPDGTAVHACDPNQPDSSGPPRYFFDTSANGVDVVDRVGFVLDDDGAARSKADAILDAIARETRGTCSVTVRDARGRQIGTRLLVRA